MSTLVNRSVEVNSKEWISLHPNPHKTAKSEAATAEKQAESTVTEDDGKHNQGALSRCCWLKRLALHCTAGVSKQCLRNVQGQLTTTCMQGFHMAQRLSHS